MVACGNSPIDCALLIVYCLCEGILFRLTLWHQAATRCKLYLAGFWHPSGSRTVSGCEKSFDKNSVTYKNVEFGGGDHDKRMSRQCGNEVS